MTTTQRSTAVQPLSAPPRAATVAGLVLGAAGITILWLAGVAFPFTLLLPPGVWILAAMAAVVAVGPWRWAPAVGAFGGLFVTVGFVASGSPPNLLGAGGPEVLVGSWVQLVGVLTALVAGVIATVGNYRAPERQDEPPSPADRTIDVVMSQPVKRATDRHRRGIVATCVALVLAAIGDAGPEIVESGSVVTGYDGPGPLIYLAFAAAVATLRWRYAPLLAVVMSGIFLIGGFADAEFTRRLITPAETVEFLAAWLQMLGFAAAMGFGLIAVRWRS